MRTKQAPNAMNTILWATQVILAATFFWAAYMKLVHPAAQLATMWPWTKNNEMLVIISGVADLLAAMGLILPGTLRIFPKLTIYACFGIIVLMVSAIIFHVSRGETSQIGINVFVTVLTAFIAWGRAER
jgi:hypothetical protein